MFRHNIPRIALCFSFVAYCAMILCWSELCSSSIQKRQGMNWKVFGLTAGAATVMLMGAMFSSSFLSKDKIDSVSQHCVLVLLQKDLATGRCYEDDIHKKKSQKPHQTHGHCIKLANLCVRHLGCRLHHLFILPKIDSVLSDSPSTL